MNTPSSSSSRRGGLRVASFFLSVMAGASLLAQASSATAQPAVVTTVKVTVGGGRFEPNRISVPVGTVHFIVTSSGGDHCFAIPSLDVEKRVRAARPLEVDVSFEKAGEFPFLCCSEPAGSTENGVIVVSASK